MTLVCTIVTANYFYAKIQSSGNNCIELFDIIFFTSIYTELLVSQELNSSLCCMRTLKSVHTTADCSVNPDFWFRWWSTKQNYDFLSHQAIKLHCGKSVTMWIFLRNYLTEWILSATGIWRMNVIQLKVIQCKQAKKLLLWLCIPSGYYHIDGMLLEHIIGHLFEVDIVDWILLRFFFSMCHLHAIATVAIVITLSTQLPCTIYTAS